MDLDEKLTFKGPLLKINFLKEWNKISVTPHCNEKQTFV